MYGGPVLSTTQAASLASTTRHTVEREIRRGNLHAEKIGRTWAIDPAEASRWAAQYTPYAGLKRQRRGKQVAPQDTAGQATGTARSSMALAGPAPLQDQPGSQGGSGQD